MEIRKLHPWNVSPTEAIAIQEKLASLVSIQEPPSFSPRLIAGADVAFDKESNLAFGAVVIFSHPDGELLETVTSVMEIPFPYIPGLLSFREAPVLLECFRKASIEPDAAMFDGHGTAHPRGLGIASHMGLLLGIPTVGCAKSRLFGCHEEPSDEKGAWKWLRTEGKRIGVVLRTRSRVKPVFVSPGHMIGFHGSIRFVMECTDGLRIPYPTRIADKAVAAHKKNFLDNGRTGR